LRLSSMSRLSSLSRMSSRPWMEVTPRVGEHSFVEVRTPMAAPRTAGFRIEEPEFVAGYALPVDPDQFDRATQIKPLSMLRPHMRIFHLAYLSGITGFIGWYALPPLMPTIKTELGLTDGEVLNSDIASTASTILSRIASGPLLDAYGPQAVQSVLLWLGAIPVICAAFVKSSTGLVIARFFVGLIGCVFVTSQYWTTITFARNVAGTANAITGGIGISGIGFAFLILPFVNELITSSGHVSADVAWRITCVLPVAFMITMGAVIRFTVDSCPMGDFENLRNAKHIDLLTHHETHHEAHHEAHHDGDDHSTISTVATTPTNIGMLKSFQIVLSDPNALIMILHYAVCFGTELQLNNMGALYFYNEFLKDGCTDTDDESCHILTKTNAAAVASAFGLMNLFARAVGGITSDAVNRRYGMKGRKCVQFVLLLVLASLVLVLSRLHSLGPCIVLYILVAIAAQATGGSTYGIVPYLNERFTGTVNGLVGAGGNLGGVVFGIIFRGTSSYGSGLFIVSFIIYASALFTPFINIKDLPESANDAAGTSKIVQDPEAQSHRYLQRSRVASSYKDLYLRPSEEHLLDGLDVVYVEEAHDRHQVV